MSHYELEPLTQTMQGDRFLTRWMHSAHWKHFVLNVTDWWCCFRNWSTDHPEIPSTLPHYSSNMSADCSDTCWIKYCTALYGFFPCCFSFGWCHPGSNPWPQDKRSWLRLNRHILFTQSCFYALKWPTKPPAKFSKAWWKTKSDGSVGFD